ncbi:Cystatin domain-containing protein [Cephalotus follicularis]|uniref:Cystatin domain-containing protein n=1 Tax=Cephalotus follicularis TaxID=3775 RepID=A0A1Q3BB38_CEPFO|nr:Cystatin domain-containing protein [Cephalotus follicularis]
MNPTLLVLVSLLILPLFATGARTEALAGEWTPIKNVKDPHVVEIGQFAVDENNKNQKVDLKFERVISGESQVVSGINYRLTLTAKDGAVENKYEAVVWEKPWEKFKKLTSFKVVNC